MSNAFERAVKRGDSRLFGDVTVQNQAAQSDTNGDPVRDDHGNIVWDDAVETDVPGELVYRGDVAFSSRADGVSDDIEAVAWIEDADEYGQEYGRFYSGRIATDGSNAEEQRASRIKADGALYVVRDTFVERNGRLRCHCEKEDY